MVFPVSLSPLTTPIYSDLYYSRCSELHEYLFPITITINIINIYAHFINIYRYLSYLLDNKIDYILYISSSAGFIFMCIILIYISFWHAWRS